MKLNNAEKTIAKQIEREDRIERDFKKADRLDRIRAHFLDNTPLDKRDKQYKERLQKSYSLLCEHHSPNQVRKFLQDDGIVYSTAWGIVNDAIDLFGDVNKHTKKGLANILSERFLRIAEKAEEAGNLDLAARIYEKLAKINGLPEDVTQLKKRRRIAINYSTDPKILALEEEQYE